MFITPSENGHPYVASRAVPESIPRARNRSRVDTVGAHFVRADLISVTVANHAGTLQLTNAGTKDTWIENARSGGSVTE